MTITLYSDAQMKKKVKKISFFSYGISKKWVSIPDTGEYYVKMNLKKKSGEKIFLPLQ